MHIKMRTQALQVLRALSVAEKQSESTCSTSESTLKRQYVWSKT